MKITYPSVVAETDLVNRALGPDALGGYLRVTTIEHIDGKTHATCRPMTPAQMARVSRDQFGQLWFNAPASEGTA